MNVLWYISACCVFFGGTLLYEKQQEVRALKKALEEQPREQEVIHRNFRSFTVR